MEHPLGIIGVATMGRSLALNFRDHGIDVALFDVDASLTAAFTAENALDTDSVVVNVPAIPAPSATSEVTRPDFRTSPLSCRSYS